MTRRGLSCSTRPALRIAAHQGAALPSKIGSSSASSSISALLIPKALKLAHHVLDRANEDTFLGAERRAQRLSLAVMPQRPHIPASPVRQRASEDDTMVCRSGTDTYRDAPSGMQSMTRADEGVHERRLPASGWKGGQEAFERS